MHIIIFLNIEKYIAKNEYAFYNLKIHFINAAKYVF